jgi:hypothetical protein
MTQKTHNDMKRGSNPMIVRVSLAVVLFGALGQTGRAQGLLNESGTSALADVFGTSTGPEALTVSWSVVENASDVYTYTYSLNNPAGDVLLNDNDTPTSTPEVATMTLLCGALLLWPLQRARRNKG